jgi:outer membrane protein assembly factor BamB
LESAWPVHGSVLVLNDVVYFVVGRSSQLDGGMCVYGLDAATGALRHRTKLEGPGYGVEGLAQNYRLPMGALPDVLQSDGELIFMRHLAFDAELAKVNPGGANDKRVWAKGGLLDDSYFKRMPWSFGAKNAYARMIAHDSERAYFVRMFETLRGLDPKVYFVPGKAGYRFFATDRANGKAAWSRQIPVRANAMAVTTDRILVAGAPDVVDPDDPLGAFEDRKGGVLYVCDKDSGQTVREYQLDSTPVFNGLAVASQCVFVSMQNGTLTCFGN